MFPQLKPKTRDREYKSLPSTTRDKIVYEYLFNGKSHRWLDENIVGINPEQSRGWQSAGTLHFLGIVDSHKGFFKGSTTDDAIKLLTDYGSEASREIILALKRYSGNVYSDDTLDLFNPPLDAKKLYKRVGTSQYTDGVRIDKHFHELYNPSNSPYYVRRGEARKIKILFNNKVFNAEYRFEDQEDKTIELQSIRFRKELKEEFKKVFPIPKGEFYIQQGLDLNHFVFTHLAETIDQYDPDMEYSEGREVFRLHRLKERDNRVITKAKELFAKQHGGRLFCEACDFDFLERYGERGRDFIEGHHKIPIKDLKEGDKTKVEDIAMLCSNCHRMIHRSPLITVEELKRLVMIKRYG